MELLLQGVEVCDKRSPFHGQKKNILIKDGIIEKITEESIDAERIIDCQDLILSIGWFDMRASFGDPGLEFKEDLKSGRKVAAMGGFTEVAILPNTIPVIQSKNDLSYIKALNPYSLTQLHPIAAVTINSEGKELTEMIDLHQSGAIAFSDGEKTLWNTDIVLKTLQYLQKFDGLLMNRPEDRLLTQFGTMNEGINSTLLGLKGMPRLAEEIAINRDLQLLEYAGGKIHFSNISSAHSVELIRRAKAKGLEVSCDVAAYQLIFDDSSLTSFDTNFKVNPPLREKLDIEALKQGLLDGTIDAIVSNHMPQDQESKKLEYDLAEFGMIGLQTVLPLLIQSGLELEMLIEKISLAPRKLLQLNQPEVKEGEQANLTLFAPNAEWEYNEKNNASLSSNSPLLGQRLTGKAVGVFNNHKVELLIED
ncbi:dihydroorotase [Xanthovirga aplysinae]|uniref:dihydroorotase n=1 Tax=Xanthovirga aplysinae TaxID=2529853 RepID=UPI0012BB974C|nr:dihydroorotase [Xanthovirga aplysinae]MTI32534.1 dihydroorotase [Xanthovirga aplysinae]